MDPGRELGSASERFDMASLIKYSRELAARVRRKRVRGTRPPAALMVIEIGKGATMDIPPF